MPDANAPPDDRPEPGSTAFDARYERRGEIARGGMGAIERVLDRHLGREVAMKVVLGAEDPERWQRFLNEARITGQLEHPAIVPVHELGTDGDGRSYFTMKLVEGESLEHVLQACAAGDTAMQARYPLERLLQVFGRVCDAVGFAHARGVVHRDLKPENVMVGNFGEVLVMDWGLARSRERGRTVAEGTAPLDADLAPGMTVDGTLLGTPAYMAPEQARGEHAHVDSRTDVFALGALLYAICTWRPPYDGSSLHAVIAAAQRAQVTPARQRAPERRVPPELEAVCARAMAADPVDRYQDAGAVAADVQAYLERRLVSAYRYGPLARAVRFAQRHPAATLTTAVALVLLGGGSGVVASVLAEKSAAEAREREAEAQREKAEATAEVERLRARESELLTAAAERRAAAAEAEFVKARRVTGLLRAARAELGGLGLALKRNAFASIGEDERLARAQALWKQVERYAAAVPDDSTAQAVWHAVRGWLYWCGGDRPHATGAFDQARAADPTVVHGWLLEALTCMASYMRGEQFSSYDITREGIRWHGLPNEQPGQRHLRERYETLVAEARHAQVWGETSADDFDAALDGFRAWYAHDLLAAEKGIGRALTVPEMEWIADDLFFMRAKARLRLMDFDGALADLQRAIAYDSLGAGPLLYRAQTLGMRGVVEERAGHDPTWWWRESVRWYGETERQYPRQQVVDQPLGLVHLNLAKWAAAHGQDPQPDLEAAMSAFTRGLDPAGDFARDYNTAVAYVSRSNALAFQAGLWEAQNRDTVDLARRALEDVLSALTAMNHLRFREDALAHAMRRWCRALSRRAEAPGPAVDAWLAELASGPDAETHAAQVWRAELLHATERFAEELPLREAHLARVQPNTYDFPDRIAALRAALAQPQWQRAHAQAECWLRLGDYARARTFAEQAVGAVPADPAAADRAEVAQLHELLARLYVAAAMGQTTIRRIGGPPEEAVAAPLRTRAIAHLARAAALGRPNVAGWRADPVYAPLRGDPAFQAIFEGR